MDNSNTEARVNQGVERAKSLPDSVQFALAKCIGNTPYGAFWGFAQMGEVKDYYSALVKDKNVIARKIAYNVEYKGKKESVGACLIEVHPDYILKAMSVLDKNAVTPKDIAKIKDKMAEAQASFTKFLMSKAKKERGYQGIIGIYCTNLVTSIVLNGVQYPAFRVNLQMAFQSLEENNFGIYLGKTLVKPSQIKNINEVYQYLILSPSQTGVFVKIKHLG